MIHSIYTQTLKPVIDFNFIRILSITLLIAHSLNLSGQVNRANIKNTNPYKGAYQRVSSGSGASHNLEIRNGALWVENPVKLTTLIRLNVNT